MKPTHKIIFVLHNFDQMLQWVGRWTMSNKIVPVIMYNDQMDKKPKTIILKLKFDLYIQIYRPSKWL